PPNGPHETVSTKDDRGIFGGLRGIFGGPCYSEPGAITFRPRVCPDILRTLISVSRNFWMRAPIEAIPVAPGSSRKVEQKTAGASSG
ncbi:Hypothetical predicted protein, partial [Olea europaea subsp. europaea]